MGLGSGSSGEERAGEVYIPFRVPSFFLVMNVNSDDEDVVRGNDKQGIEE